MSTLSQSVANYLTSLGHLRHVRPVTVTIKDEIFYGARYERVNTYTHDMMACQRGDKQPGDSWVDDCIYLVGLRPKLNNYTCFICKDVDWYVSAYYDEDIIPDEFKRYHPFGKSFILMPWTLDEPIDYYEANNYTRVPMVVSNL